MAHNITYKILKIGDLVKVLNGRGWFIREVQKESTRKKGEEEDETMMTTKTTMKEEKNAHKNKFQMKIFYGISHCTFWHRRGNRFRISLCNTIDVAFGTQWKVKKSHIQQYYKRAWANNRLKITPHVLSDPKTRSKAHRMPHCNNSRNNVYKPNYKRYTNTHTHTHNNNYNNILCCIANVQLKSDVVRTRTCMHSLTHTKYHD